MSENNINSNEKVQAKPSKNKLKNEYKIEELEKINEENIKNYSFRNKRNRVIIIVLSILLILAIGGTIAYVLMSKLSTNCEVITHGNTSCTYYIDNKPLTKFRTPGNLQGDRILEFELNMKINAGGKYNVRFTILTFQDEKLMDNIIVYQPNIESNVGLFELGANNYYYSSNAITGNKIINLCQGVVIDPKYENTLNADNFKLEVHVYVEKV